MALIAKQLTLCSLHNLTLTEKWARSAFEMVASTRALGLVFGGDPEGQTKTSVIL